MAVSAYKAKQVRLRHLRLMRDVIDKADDVYWPVVLEVMRTEAAAEQLAHYWRTILVELKEAGAFYGAMRPEHGPFGRCTGRWEVYVDRRKR
jgi:hypothetical protein